MAFITLTIWLVTLYEPVNADAGQSYEDALTDFFTMCSTLESAHKQRDMDERFSKSQWPENAIDALADGCAHEKATLIPPITVSLYPGAQITDTFVVTTAPGVSLGSGRIGSSASAADAAANRAANAIARMRGITVRFWFMAFGSASIDYGCAVPAFAA
jgi:hypothetical protein